MPPRADWLRWGAFALIFQSVAAAVWWLILWLEPRSRAYFRPSDAPDAVLLAFALPDAFLFIGAALWAAKCLIKTPEKAVVPLALHSGAAVSSALYCGMQWLLTGEAFWAALLMAPCLVLGPLLLWKLTRD